MKKLFPFLIFILCLPEISFCQSRVEQRKIDSLINLLNATKTDTGRVNVLNALSKKLRLTNNVDRSGETANKALALAKTLNFKKGMADAYNNIGVAFVEHANYQEALKNYNLAMEIRKELGDKFDICWTYINIGNVFFQQGSYPEALKNYFTALRMAEEMKDNGIVGNAYNCIGNVYAQQNNYSEALKNYAEALRTFGIGDKHAASMTYDNIGTIYTKQGNYDEALNKFSTVIEMQGTVGGDTLLMASSYGNIGDVYTRQHKYPEALKSYLKALEMQGKVMYKYGMGDSYINIGKIYFYEHNEPQARDYLLKGLSLAKENDIKEELKDAYNLLSKLDSSVGNVNGAYQYFKLYAQAKDSIVNEESNKQMSQLKIQYETDKKDQQIKTQALQNNILQNRIYYSVTISLIIIAIGVLLFYLRNRRKKREYEHTLVSLELTALKSQLNPHFISNSLIALKAYINKQPERANEFLVKFARLMRRVLEQSEQPLTSLKEELETAELYLQLESLRLKYSFHFSIECDPSIDQEIIKVPPLILQPAIENAVRHGLVPKGENGFIAIKVEAMHGLLKLTVEDNGVGEASVMKKGNASSRNKKSFGLSITRKRVEVLGKEFNQVGYLELKFLPGKTITEIALPVKSF